MMIQQENFQINHYCPKKGWEELNAVITGIGQLQSFSECIGIILRDFDETRTPDGLSDKQCLEFVNQMLVMLETNEQRLKSLTAIAEKAFDAIYKM